MNRNLYIGEFPPPMGGVTVKNALIKDQIYKDSDILFFDLYSCKKNPLNLIKLLSLIFATKGNIVLGLGSNPRLERLLQVISLLKGKGALNRCSVIMMGSTLQKYCKNHPKMSGYLRNVRAIYTESEQINREFLELGINQTVFFPNCRMLPKEDYAGKSIDGSQLRMVFFSKICKEKGAHYLVDVIDQLNAMGVPAVLDYYGVIGLEYEAEFKGAVESHENIRYQGIFDASKDDVYKKLNEYDLLVFPTTWKGEGVAGILVESKFAGIPAIVTDHNYNGEVVINDVEGIAVFSENIVDGFVESICRLQKDTAEFERLAKGAYQSKDRYDIENYRVALIKAIKE